MTEALEATRKEMQFVAFKLQTEEFAIDIYRVSEVLKLLPITPLPQSAKFIEGVINIRGTVVPVIDLRRRFELADRSKTDETRIIIIDIGEEPIGLIVDEVTEVLKVDSSDIQPPPKSSVGSNSGLLEGVARVGDRLIIVLKIESLLSSSERLVLDDIRDEAEEAAEEMTERDEAPVSAR